jgi:hypothetical protein
LDRPIADSDTEREKMKHSVAEHTSQSNHATWNFLCECQNCGGYFIKVRKSDIPVALAKLGYEDEVTTEEWATINHRLVSYYKGLGAK